MDRIAIQVVPMSTVLALAALILLLALAASELLVSVLSSDEVARMGLRK